MPKNSSRERREGGGARRIRLANTLMQIYANPENARASHRVKFDDEFGLLLQKWREVRPEDHAQYLFEPEAPPYRDYRDALRRVVGKRLGLADEHGNPLYWALRWVDRRVQLVASRWDVGEDWNRSRAWVDSPLSEESYYGDLDGFTLNMNLAYFFLGTPRRVCEQLLEIADHGLGPDEWTRYRDLAHQAVEDAIEDMKAQFEEDLEYEEDSSDGGTWIRPTSIEEKDRHALMMLHEHLVTGVKFREKRAKHERASKIARSLGIQYPRRPLP